VELTDSEPHFLVFRDSGSGKSSFLRTWMKGLVARRSAWEARVVVDYRRSLLGVLPQEYVGAYAGDANAARLYVEQVAARLAERLPPPDTTMEQLRDSSWWTGPEFYVVVDDYDLVGGSGRTSPLTPLVDYLPQAREIGLHVVVARRVAGLSRSQMREQLLSRVRELGTAGLVLSGDPREGVVLGDERAGPPPSRSGRPGPPRLPSAADSGGLGRLTPYAPNRG